MLGKCAYVMFVCGDVGGVGGDESWLGGDVHCGAVLDGLWLSLG